MLTGIKWILIKALVYYTDTDFVPNLWLVYVYIDFVVFQRMEFNDNFFISICCQQKKNNNSKAPANRLRDTLGLFHSIELHCSFFRAQFN